MRCERSTLPLVRGECGFDVNVINVEVLDVPMKFDLELVAVVYADHAHAKLELSQDVIDEFDRVLLVATWDIFSARTRVASSNSRTGNTVPPFGHGGTFVTIPGGR